MIFHGCSMVFSFHNSSCAGPVSDGVVWVLDSRFQLVRRLHKFGMPLGRGVLYSYVFMFIICLIWWPRVLAGCQRHSQNFVKDRSVSGALVDRLGTAMVEFNYSTPHPAHVCSKLLKYFPIFLQDCFLRGCISCEFVLTCILWFALHCCVAGCLPRGRSMVLPALLALFESQWICLNTPPCCIWVLSESTQVHPHESAKANTRVQGAISLACRICNDLRPVWYRGGLLNRAKGICPLSIFSLTCFNPFSKQ